MIYVFICSARENSFINITYCSRCSDNAAVKERMLISSTKDAIVKKLDGANGYQASDESDLEYKAVCDGVSKGKAKWN